MIECVYYNDFIRCYRDGSVERLLKIKRKGYEIGDWKKCGLKPNKTTGYLHIRINDKIYPSHRIIAFCFGKLNEIQGINDTNDVDHINGIITDNRIENLRQVTHQQNLWNYTKAKGYSWSNAVKKWRSTIVVNRKQINLGCYDTEEEARNAYLTEKEIHHVI